MRTKIIIGMIVVTLLVLSLPSISAIQQKTIQKTAIMQEKNEVKNVWLKILMFTIFTGSLVLISLLLQKLTGGCQTCK